MNRRRYATSPLPRRRVTVLAALTLVALVLASLPAMGSPAERYPYAERVDLAGAAWITETANSLTDLTIRISSVAERSLSGPIRYDNPGIVLFYVHRETDPTTGAVTETNYEGIYGGPDGTLSFKRSFAGASATFSIVLWGYQCQYPPDGDGGGPQGITAAEPTCYPLDDVSVDGTIAWTGYGEIWRDTNNTNASDPGLAMWGAHTVEALRNAIATGTIAVRDADGVVLADGHAEVGVLLRGKYHEQSVFPRP